MKRLMLSTLILGMFGSGSAMAAEGSAASGIKFGLNFEQQAYLRHGLMVEMPVDGSSFVGLNIGSQSVFETNADGIRKVRPQVDYVIYLGSGSRLPDISRRWRDANQRLWLSGCVPGI